MQEEAFVKSQLIAFCKALSKVESPLKQKHVRALVVGTHKLRSSRIFWHAVSRIQLEKNPVLTWKFCQLLHKLIHDGHRKVTEESVAHIPRLTQLGNFWQHLRSSGYGQANTSYCKMLVSRLNFHKKYPSLPGNFSINARQTEALTSDINETYELAIDMLDQMDELLNLKASIISVMDSLRWSSLVPQGQCLLAPLILVILDTSKLYDFLVKALFKLHANLSADTLIGHRERFYDIFRRTKKFYEEAANLQYFKYLVQIPTLPTIAPNFQKAHELEEYQAPQAYLHSVATSESGDQSPTDTQSVCDEQISTIIDLSMPQMDADFPSSAGPSTSQQQQQQQTPQLFDPKDEIIARLRHDIDVERETKERLIQEASIRIEQYEARLVQMKQEIDLNKQTADERAEELNELRTELSNNRTEQQQQQQGTEVAEGQAAEEAARKQRELEQKLAKLKGLYQQLREDHIKALTEIRDLRTKIDTDGEEKRKNDDELENTKQQLKQTEQERAFFESQAKLVQENIRTSAQTVHEAQSKIGQLEGQIEEVNDTLASEKAKTDELERKSKATNERILQTFRECLCSAALAILEQSLEDLQNASSISYPLQLAMPSLRTVIDQLDSVALSPSFATLSADQKSSSLLPLSDQFKSLFVLSHRLSDVLIGCASAAYTVSIQHFEEVNEQCRRVHTEAAYFYKDLLKEQNEGKGKLRTELGRLEALVGALPSETGAGGGDIDVEMVGRQLDEEMQRMGTAIATAVEHIGELQKRSRETNSGMRLEVNDKILDSCNGLMNAVRELVIRSKEVQEEIVAQGKGATTPSEFYKKNHLWTEGLISAGRAVGVAATELVKSADSFIMGKGGKFEHLIVAAGSVAASVAQLFVSSRVKAKKGSETILELGKASKSVNLCTAALVGTVKSGQQSLAEEQLLDFSNLSLHETKKEEMESQVRVLELEAELTRERLRFGELRKQHFHLASLVEQQNKENGKEATD